MDNKKPDNPFPPGFATLQFNTLKSTLESQTELQAKEWMGLVERTKEEAADEFNKLTPEQIQEINTLADTLTATRFPQQSSA